MTAMVVMDAGRFLISTDRAKLDVDTIHHFLTRSYWGGLGKELIATVMAHPELQGLRRWSLGTRDAHRLYAPFGFTPVESPSRIMMEIVDQEVYQRPADKARQRG